jgi:hypothetical protein
MRRLLLLVSLFFGLVLLPAEPASTCGDKLLALGRAMRFQDLSPARHPASILLYAPTGSIVSNAIRDPQFQSELRKAGHSFLLVEERGRLEEAVKLGRYDLVLASVADAPSLEDQFAGLLLAPLVLPFVYQGTKTENDNAQQRFHCLLKLADKPSKHLGAIERAMELKAKRDRNLLRASK